LLWENDPSEMLRNSTTPLYEKYPHEENNHLLQEINEHIEPVRNKTAFICGCLKEVVEKQLNDFILEGKYSTEPSVEFKDKTKHSKLTNIQAENLFGDLDYSMKRKPKATLRHHSAIIMLKRNKPLQWINKKSRGKKTHFQYGKKKCS
jgi:BioD-like phosphotransacetylase family protein